MLDLKSKMGIRLDIGCGANKQPGFVGMDIQPLPGVDIVHDINIHPWEMLPDGCALLAMCSHLVEHIPPVAFRGDGSTWFPFLEFMNEVWRVLAVDGQFAISAPHGWSSGYLQDPTHCNQLNEFTFAYFDPEGTKYFTAGTEGGELFGFYKPKPWKIEQLFSDPSANIEVVLRKRSE